MSARRATSPHMQRFGAHMSAVGGVHNAFAEGLRVGCDCLQLFVKNQRQWTAAPLSDEQIRLFQDAKKAAGISPVVAHASYLLNLASPDEANRNKSVAALVDELERCEALGLDGLIVHPGAHMGDGEPAGIRRIASSLDETHRRTRGFQCPVLLETTAGQGTTLGRTIEELAETIGATRDGDRLGICLDTCHLFAAGYDLRDKEACNALVTKIDRLIDAKRVRCIHTNDSKGDLGSRIDRHEHITKGNIGRAGFANLLNDPRLTHAPRILETPKGEDERGRDLDRVNLSRLRRMVAIKPTRS